uniref:ATP synthase subunit a n=1 Tax=Balamuthia mandrillaris TaxID=66527 RepID=A0A0K1HP34_9EUKA|nr:ATP synthase subunit 6 [Balamuthia mandrillaris]
MLFLVKSIVKFVNNPLEQFQINVIFKCCCDSIFSIFVTNLTVFFGLLWFLFFSFFFFPLLFSTRVSNFYNFLYIFYFFVLDLFNNQLNNLRAKKFFFYFFICFIFVLFSNFLGIFPYSFTITSHFIQTFGVSFSTFLGIFLLGFVNFELKFLQLFVPQNVPKALVPFLVVLEIISYLIRPFSLSLRLFANMMAGHISMHILLSFNFFMFKNKFFFLFLVSFTILFLIFVLEFSIVFIQAYVFLTLLLIYLNDSFNLH